MIEVDTVIHGDCMEGMKSMPDACVDLVLIDPPYSFKGTSGGGAFGSPKGDRGRVYHTQLAPMSDGMSGDVLDEACRVCRIPNMYVFCNKDLLPQILDWSVRRRLNFDLLAWHKTNPTPMCCNKYLSDTEYIVFMRGSGAKVHGTYASKRKFWVQPTNMDDKRRYGHPTVKPLNIVRTLIANSSLPGETVLDPFAGSGTAAVAARLEGRHYIGFEIDGHWCDVARRRLEETIS